VSNRRRAALVALPAAALLLAATAAPASAQTAAPSPTPAAADAGAALFTVRALPGASLPGVTGTGLLTGAIASTVVTADSTKPAGQQSTATAAPFALTLAGQSPTPPTTASQTASPDHATPTTTGFTIPAQLAPLLSGGVLQGSAQARYSDTVGFCVDPISTATTSLANLSAVNVLPALSLPTTGTGDPTAALGSLTGLLTGAQSGFGGLAGLLTGQSSGTTSVVKVPDTASATSTTKLVDVAGQAGKGIQASSGVQLGNIQLLPGTPLGVTVNVIKAPTLTATSTGDPATSGVTYTAPVVEITQADGTVIQKLAAVDDPSTAADETQFSIPLQIPVLGSDVAALPTALSGLLQPILGPVVNQATGAIRNLDLGLLTVKYGQFTEAPANGASVGGSASLLDVAVLPTTTLTSLLGSALPAGTVPDSLLQLGVGEQTARASVGAGGIDCSTPAPPAAVTPPPAPGAPQASGPPPLAYTSGAYSAIPLMWTGSALLILGALIVAALPRRRRVTSSA
jgi:hypothetical protein